jgi:hypothetical protein
MGYVEMSNNVELTSEAKVEDNSWAHKSIVIVGQVQDQFIYASFDEAGLVFDVSLDKDYLVRSLVIYSQALENNNES